MDEQSIRTNNDLPTSPGNGRREAQSTIGLLRQLLNEVSTLFRKEIALATAEVTEALSEVKVAAVSMASGGAVLFAGLLVLLASAVLALNLVVPHWLAALIVGVIVTAIGYVMIHSGKEKLNASTFKPERTQRSLQEDKDMLQRRI
jgi:uncharacterized protein YacL